MSQPAVVVVGSLNMDFVVRVRHLPGPGQTVLGTDFRLVPGGKGANQACAAGRLSGGRVPVRMAGRVGDDVFAGQLKGSLAAAGVDVSAVEAAADAPTGVALIWVDDAGQNSIVVASGANHRFPPAETARLEGAFRGAAFVLFQLETPLDTVAAALKLARGAGARTMLDPAPAQPLPSEMLGLVDILTPNESEALILLGRPPGRVTFEDAPQLAASLRALGPNAVVLKLGDRGCYYDSESGRGHAEAFPVEACDSTAAGDIFNGAMAVALAEGRPFEAALRFANAAAAISVTRPGAQPSVPARGEVEALLAT
jgi:ribokinase